MTQDDPRIARLHALLRHRPAAAAPRPPGTREAAVALLLRPREQLELLLIKRAEHESDPWSGHMALPGGRREPQDEGLLATAMREVAEEVGVQTHARDHLGTLDEIHPRSARLPSIVIAPFVLAVPPDTTAQADQVEVDAALWVPLPALADEGAAHELVLELEGASRHFPAYRLGEHVIWGLTHRILEQFLEVSREAGVL
jgi:ADP-ribose pyrophosphatase YjhB (NUDIX family)